MKVGTERGCFRRCFGEVCPSLQVDLIGKRWAPQPEEESVTRSVDYRGSMLPSGPSA
ncbi:MAG: hypothetical protein ACLQCU_09830 [Acidimicrobiales bacterium]|jgi:hypothetical protein